MLRLRLSALCFSSLGLAGLAAGTLLTAPSALAQFGPIFREEAPRPPADVPSRGRQTEPYYPSNADRPPAQPLPPPMNLPPSNRPGSGSLGGIQSEELTPLPGTAAPRAPAPAPQQPAQNAPPGQAPAAPQPGQPPVQTVAPGQRIQGQPQTPQQASTNPSDEVVVEPPPQRIANPTAEFSGLDKITGRIIKFDVAINETVQFGALQVTPRVCYSRPPTENANTDSFVEVDEVTLQGEVKRIFNGWMFAASPGLNAIEHPVYDVWVTDCKGAQVAEAPADPAPARAQPAQPAQRRSAAPARPQQQPPRPQQFQQSAPPPPGFFPGR